MGDAANLNRLARLGNHPAAWHRHPPPADPSVKDLAVTVAEGFCRAGELLCQERNDGLRIIASSRAHAGSETSVAPFHSAGSPAEPTGFATTVAPQDRRLPQLPLFGCRPIEPDAPSSVERRFPRASRRRSPSHGFSRAIVTVARAAGHDDDPARLTAVLSTSTMSASLSPTIDLTGLRSPDVQRLRNKSDCCRTAPTTVQTRRQWFGSDRAMADLAAFIGHYFLLLDSGKVEDETLRPPDAGTRDRRLRLRIEIAIVNEAITLA